MVRWILAYALLILLDATLLYGWLPPETSGQGRAWFYLASAFVTLVLLLERLSGFLTGRSDST